MDNARHNNQIQNSKQNLRDILDWIIISGGVSERELSRRFKLKPALLKSIIMKFEKLGLVKRKKSLLGTQILFNSNSEQGMKEKSRLLPSVKIIDEEKRFITNLDILKSLVDRFGAIELKMVARFLNTDYNTVEKWAETLQSRGLVTLKYPLIGSPIISQKDEKNRILVRTLIKYALVIIVAGIIIYLL